MAIFNHQPNGTYNPKAEYSFQTDMYSFGVTLWELVSGKAPFSQYDDITVRVKYFNDEREAIPDECETEAPKVAALIQFL